MMSRRSKWLIAGFALAPISYSVVLFYSFRMLHQMQKILAQAKTGQIKPDALPSPDALVHTVPLEIVPVVFLGIGVGCVCAMLALVSLIFDHRTKRT